MKYAINYYMGCPILDKADEIIIQYYEKDPELIHFVEKYPDTTRIIIDVCNLGSRADNLAIFEAAQQKHKNLALRTTSSDPTIPDYAEAFLPFFYVQEVSDIDDLYSYVNSGVSDVYITNAFAFSMKDVATYCKASNVQIRVLPNVAQSKNGGIPPKDTLKTFFIRPEDIDIYEDYVDVFEFFGSLDKQPILYKIYTEKRWAGQLNEIILNLKDNTDNRSIPPYFGERRLNCGKKCVYGKCHVCDAISSLDLEFKTKVKELADDKNDM